MSQHVKTSPFKARRAVSTRNLFWVLANFCAAIFLFKKIACIQKISECQDVYDILITSKYFIFWWHKNLWFLLCSKMPFFLSIVKDVQISPFYALTIKGETHIFWGIICVSHYKNILDIRKIAPSNSIFQDGVGDFSGNFFDFQFLFFFSFHIQHLFLLSQVFLIDYYLSSFTITR